MYCQTNDLFHNDNVDSPHHLILIKPNANNFIFSKVKNNHNINKEFLLSPKDKIATYFLDKKTFGGNIKSYILENKENTKIKKDRRKTQSDAKIER